MKKSRRFFFNAMSHELRTPLAIMVSNLELLQPMVSSPEQLEYLNDIQKEGDSVLKKVNDMLDYASMMEGLVVVKKFARPFVPFVRAIVEEYQVKYGRTIGFTNPAELAGCSRFDQDLVSSALRNILENSCRYAKSSRDQISVRLFRPSADQLSRLKDLPGTEHNDETCAADCITSMVTKSRLSRIWRLSNPSLNSVLSSASAPVAPDLNGGVQSHQGSQTNPSTLSHFSMVLNETTFALEVIDAGPGIESAVLPKIFRPFRDFNEGANRSTAGCGFGLPITRLMVREMGGEVMVTSPWPPGANGGTKVLVLLPMELVGDELAYLSNTSNRHPSNLVLSDFGSVKGEPVSEATLRPKQTFGKQTSANDLAGVGSFPKSHPSASGSGGSASGRNASAGPEQCGARQVLVAEDTPALQRLIDIQLRKLGYEA